MKWRLRKVAIVASIAITVVIVWMTAGLTFFQPNEKRRNNSESGHLKVTQGQRSKVTASRVIYEKLDKKIDAVEANEVMKDEDFDDDDNDSVVGLTRNNNNDVKSKPSSCSIRKIDCLINDEYTVSCLKSNDEQVYVPFTFIKKYFDIQGKVIRKGNDEVMSWQHSYSKVFYPRKPYRYTDGFLWFENYNVEIRDRVKCVSAIHGVPISTQWSADGHFYPIQIAQFGLSHFTKNITEERPRVLILEDGTLRQDAWTLEGDDGTADVVSLESNNGGNKIVQFGGTTSQVTTFKIKKRHPRGYNDLNLSLDVKPHGNLTIVAVLRSDSGTELKVTYTTRDEDIVRVNDGAVYGIGTKSDTWIRLSRNLGVDVIKAYSVAGKKLSIKPKTMHLTRVTFRGQGSIDNVTLSSALHEAHFHAAADWLLNNQDPNGGWSIKVTRRLSNGALILKPGWYSAMAQGQAISLLTRMFHRSGDERYLTAAKNAISLFDVGHMSNGIKTYFLDKYVWYEEYPTNPSSFVLNGFVYALFGLYDLKMTCDDSECEKAGVLFENGFNSLKTLLPLFDTGSGSVYDLRHLGLNVPPNIARWDYHTTHINQLMFLTTIKMDAVIQSTAKRWISYTKGKRAPHN